MSMMRVILFASAILWATSARGELQAGTEFTVSESVAFDGNIGWTHEDVTYRLACAVNLVEAGNGDLLVTWLSGSDQEPAPDNCVLMARSIDGGSTWSQPHVLLPAGQHAAHVTNLYRTEDGELIALGAYWPAEDEYTTWYYFRMRSRDDGHTWTQPQPFTLLGNRASLGRRIRLNDGRWLFPGTFFQKREAPLHGSIQAIIKAGDEAQVRALKNTIPEPNTNKFSRFLHGSMAFMSAEDPSDEILPLGQIDNRPMGLIEPSIVQLDDESVVMLMRAEWGGYLWESRSEDRGATWTPARPTDIPNPSSMAQLLRLQDGRVALFLNPTGRKVGGRGPRDPLAMWISDDGLRSWEYKKVIASGGRCAYPHAMQTRDGRVLVAYDRDRRGVRLLSIKLDQD